MQRARVRAEWVEVMRSPPRSRAAGYRAAISCYGPQENSHSVARMPAFWGTPDEIFRADRTVGNVENDPLRSRGE
jgi:hypothetical protein